MTDIVKKKKKRKSKTSARIALHLREDIVSGLQSLKQQPYGRCTLQYNDKKANACICDFMRFSLRNPEMVLAVFVQMHWASSPDRSQGFLNIRAAKGWNDSTKTVLNHGCPFDVPLASSVMQMTD